MKSASAATPDAVTPTNAAPAAKAFGADAGKPAVPGAKTAPIKLMAGFTDLPGATTTGRNESKSENALWLDTSLTPTAPMGGRGPQHFGVTRGQGALIGTYDAPLTDQTPAVGTGEIATRLLYGSKVDQSFAVVVTGVDPKKKAAASLEARALTTQATEREGDVSVIETTVAAALAAKYPAAAGSSIQVKLTPAKSATSVTDAGLRKLYYKVGGPTSVVMEVKAAPAGTAEVHTSAGSEESVGGGAHVDGHTEHEHTDVDNHDTKSHVDGHHEQSQDKLDVESMEKMVESENRFVTSFSQAVKRLTSKLIDKAKADGDEHKRDHDVKDADGGAFDDYSKKDSHSTEAGEKPKRNWAYYLKSIAEIAHDAVEGPRKIGTLEFPEILWGLDVLGKGAGKFEVNERVKYTEATDDSDVHDKRGNHDKVDDDRHQDGDSHSKSNRDALLTKAITTAGASLVSRVANTTQTIQRSYHSTESKTASGGGASVDSNSAHDVTDKTGTKGDTHIDAQRSKTTRLQYDVSKSMKYLRPQLDVTVTEGDGEVASAAFSAKPGHE